MSISNTSLDLFRSGLVQLDHKFKLTGDNSFVKRVNSSMNLKELQQLCTDSNKREYLDFFKAKIEAVTRRQMICFYIGVASLVLSVALPIISLSGIMLAGATGCLLTAGASSLVHTYNIDQLAQAQIMQSRYKLNLVDLNQWDFLPAISSRSGVHGSNFDSPSSSSFFNDEFNAYADQYKGSHADWIELRRKWHDYKLAEKFSAEFKRTAEENKIALDVLRDQGIK